MSRQEGFTLIEIIIVVAIFMVIVSFGMTVDWHVFKADYKNYVTKLKIVLSSTDASVISWEEL